MDRALIVAPDGSGDYPTVGAALAFAAALPPGPLEIRLRAGAYREKLRIERPRLRLVGEGADRTRLVWGDHATALLPDGERMGTFNSYTAYIGAPDVSLEGIAIVNDAGDGRLVGQAVALYADADRLAFERCAFLARQDTVCLGPLPRDPPPKGVNLLHPVAGLGPEEPALPFRMAFRGCLAAGDVDFVFGSAAALFEGCEIRSLGRGGGDSYIAAPSTYPGQEAGFVFDRCRLTFTPAAPGAAGFGEGGPERVFLGRPWRPRGRAVFYRCELGSHIAAEGWDDWGKPEARDLGYLGELGSTGPGASPSARVPWAGAPAEEEVEAMIRAIRF
ncbi:MAG TPA: pectinesterase family protein [Spirochaetales bacterium]|nr:pectinesterase family protein [Spirochaetales bacterium]HRY54675.1 pectinesterase family protein [Spirochaetia bacterium]HRZ66319.1 pectinesterase family protein [Spirochaetia bacterium]